MGIQEEDVLDFLDSAIDSIKKDNPTYAGRNAVDRIKEAKMWYIQSRVEIAEAREAQATRVAIVAGLCEKDY